MAFDIVEWHRRRFPTKMCDNCRAIYTASELSRASFRKCSVCETDVFKDPNYPVVNERETSPMANLGTLAAIASVLPPHVPPEKMRVEPLAAVFQAINAAQWFIHFTTYTLDSTFLGALHLASHRAQVRGVVGNMNAYTMDALESMNGLRLKDPQSPLAILTSTAKTPTIGPMHFKLLVIDGLIAFKGSANLTVNGYVNSRRDAGTDGIEVVSVPDEVAKLNNFYFARHWGQNTPQISGEDYLPF